MGEEGYIAICWLNCMCVCACLCIRVDDGSVDEEGYIIICWLPLFHGALRACCPKIELGPTMHQPLHPNG